MIRGSLFLFTIILFKISLFAQQQIDSVQKIEEVVIETRTPSPPLSKNSYSISIITAREIEKLPVTSLEEVLQHINGVDVRRRGIEGMQSDLYIRGGSFNQTLLLIDGVKVDDLQTGHHTMNAMIDLSNVERIEVIKGAAARVFGSNAMNGAINIITKDLTKDKTELSLSAGSYDNYAANIAYQKVVKDASIRVQVIKQQSNGYRFNTDFDNWNSFLKAKWHTYELLASYSKRDFGANGFYASPVYKDQYEETETSLIALKRKLSIAKWSIQSSLYWRWNKDLYLFLRQDPAFYRNLHINNKVGFTIHADLYNKIGELSVGIDLNQGFLSSNNLGNHKRFSTTLFAEQAFHIIPDKLTVTPGVVMVYYSDFKTFVYPGIDFGYSVSDHYKLYLNTGYTSRIPTYTNLFYTSSIEKGNPDLKPEKALTTEVGMYFNNKLLQINVAAFTRKATDLIDWTKENETDPWEAQNFSKILTNGFEFEGKYGFKIHELPQNINLSYTYIYDSIKDVNIPFSRYSINSYKHRVTSQITTQFFSFLQQTISYGYSERTNGESYHLFDASIAAKIKNWKITYKANNIFSTEYTETNLVPMPKFNFMLEVSCTF